MHSKRTLRRRNRQVGAVLIAGIALSGCDMLVDLPHVLSDSAIEGPGSARTQVMSAMGLFEAGASLHAYYALGHEDVLESIIGSRSGDHRYSATFAAGLTGTTSMATARTMISTAPSRLVPSAQGQGKGVYDRLQDEWSLGAEGQRLSAIAAIYMAASLTYMGEFFCEAALDGSDLLTPNDLLTLAEDWITTRALVHINSAGDFALPNGASPSARNLAVGLRSRIRWAKGDLAGAEADALTVLGASPRFNAAITREAGQEIRYNTTFRDAYVGGYSGMMGRVTWWNTAVNSPNPVTGQRWTSPIPHTGYLFLGILPDGRTLEERNVPVLWASEERTPAERPIPLTNGAVADTRVKHEFTKAAFGRNELPSKYMSDDDDIPFVTWRELTLIRADRHLEQGDLAGAISRVNELRSFHRLPPISGAYQATLLGSATATRHMLLEEWRREFFGEGRYWSVKIKNTDVLWFPRLEGQTFYQRYQMLGGVRLLFPASEFEQNPNFVARGGLAARGTGCPAGQRPLL
jgi:hypothetical protein